MHENEKINCDQTLSLRGKIGSVDKAIAVGPRLHNGQSGYHLYAPLFAKDGSVIFVNWGWSPDKSLNVDDGFKDIVINVSGLFFDPKGANMFTPAGNADQNEWYAFELDKAIDVFISSGAAAISDKVLFAKSIDPMIFDDFNAAQLSRSYLTPQMHFQYAGFWYLLALTFIAVFLFRFVLRIEK